MKYYEVILTLLLYLFSVFLANFTATASDYTVKK